MKTVRFSPGCGVEIQDQQLAELKDEELLELRRAFTEHGLLFFRDQVLEPEQHLNFANRFGDIVLNKFF